MNDSTGETTPDEKEHIRKEVAERGLVVFEKTFFLLNGDYPIGYSRVTSPLELFKWVWLLQKKEWYTPQLLNDFLFQFAELHGDPRTQDDWDQIKAKYAK